MFQNMSNNKVIFLLFFIYSLNSLVCAEDDELSGYMHKCCQHGIKHARKYDHCQNYEFEADSISRLWIGLCRSTYRVCCSRQTEAQDCLTGRMAALQGSDCSKPPKVNTTSTAFKDCCGFCQLGLAVKASTSQCDDALFSYFNEIESYRICCGNYEKEPKPDIPEKNDNASDGTIVLSDGDDDICSKVNLCPQICENTLEAYRCKCFPGYKLNADNITCSPSSEAGELNETENDIKSSDVPSAKQEILSNSYLNEDNLELNDDVCPDGYVYDKITRKCVDLDECAIKSGAKPCEDNQFCHNTMGSYHCLNKESTSNSDEECEECDEGYTCVTVAGRHKCVLICMEGFEWVNDSCQDINECVVDKNTCSDTNRTCVNEFGTYRCDCKVGFRYDSTENQCIDINECSINNHDCLDTQRCDNTLGSYICTRLLSCGTGYTLNADTGECIDNDECKHNTHNCMPNYDCHNTKGSFRCIRRVTTTTTTTSTTTTTTTTARPTTTTRVYDTYWRRYQNRSNPSYSSQTYDPNYARERNPNYISSGKFSSCPIGFARNEQGACTDIDECLDYKPCRSHQRCLNTNGSFRCKNRLECGSGYMASPDSSRCIDINECETGEHNCAESQICHNREGGFICHCPEGFQLKRTEPDGIQTCVDINECEQERPSVCPRYSECLNNIGSYDCECQSGYKKDASKDRLCTDVDECTEMPGLCQHDCHNIWGGYYCSCKSGYELGSDNRSCVDVNECEVYTNNELCMDSCVNLPGSYKCTCPRGYNLLPDKQNCRDIDECKDFNFCTGRNDICTNTHGSYKCTNIRCPLGYRNHDTKKNVCVLNQQFCTDESCYSKAVAYTYYFITLTSKLPVPPESRRIFALKAEYDGNVEFDLKMTKAESDQSGVEIATQNYFEIQKEDRNHLTVRLRKPLEGPQDIELELSMTMFRHGMPSFKSVTKLIIIVSKYKF